MRFMMLLKADQNSEAGVMPNEDIFAEMARYNEEMAQAGVLLSGEGLHPSAQGAKVKFSRGQPTVVDGPFAEAKELIAGFWMIQTPSKAEAVEWAKRCPNPPDGEMEIELRQVFEDDDFGAEFTPELREREARLREQLASRH